MEKNDLPEETVQQAAMHIGEALSYLTREAKTAGLTNLAESIEVAELSARENAKGHAYLQV